MLRCLEAWPRGLDLKYSGATEVGNRRRCRCSHFSLAFVAIHIRSVLVNNIGIKLSEQFSLVAARRSAGTSPDICPFYGVVNPAEIYCPTIISLFIIWNLGLILTITALEERCSDYTAYIQAYPTLELRSTHWKAFTGHPNNIRAWLSCNGPTRNHISCGQPMPRDSLW
jgi:hypothetical protein